MCVLQANTGLASQADQMLEQPAVDLQGADEDAQAAATAAGQEPEGGVLGDSMLSVDALRISENTRLLTAPGACSTQMLDASMHLQLQRAEHIALDSATLRALHAMADLQLGLKPLLGSPCCLHAQKDAE